MIQTKILMLTDGMDGGGAETHVATLAEGLAERGVEVAVLSNGGRMASALRERGIRQYSLCSIGRSPLGLLRAREQVERLQAREDFGVIHAHARGPARALGLCGFGGTEPLRLVTVHAAYPVGGLLGRVSYWGNHTVAVSEDLRARVCDGFGVPAEAVTVIPNGIDCRRFYPSAVPPPCSVLFASRLDGDCSRGAELLLELALPLKRVFPALTVTFAGGGSALPRLRARAEELQRAFGERFLFFLGSVEDMAREYQRHGVFVGVSRAAMEASACGCSVILCGNEGFGGLLTPNDPVPALSNFCCRGLSLPSARLLATHLAPLLAHPVAARRRALVASRFIRSRFSASSMVDRYLSMCRELLDNQPLHRQI